MYVSDFVSDKCSFFQSYFCDFLCEGVFSGFRTTSSGFYVAVLLFLLTNHITSDLELKSRIFEILFKAN